MRVQQFQRSHFVVPDNARNPSQRKFKLLRFRRRRKKKSILRRPRPHWFCCQLNFDDGSARRMRLQIKLQQLEKSSRVEQGNGKPESALKTSSAWTAGDARHFIICREIFRLPAIL